MEYTAEATGAFGDMEYSLRLMEKRELTIWLILPDGVGSSTSGGSDATVSSSTATALMSAAEDTPADSAREVASTGTTYTIKSGDSLWLIAQQQLGDGSRYKEIFELNEEVLESEARKYNHHCTLSNLWIFAGTVIALPEK